MNSDSASAGQGARRLDDIAALVDLVLVTKVLPPSLRVSLDNLLKAGETEDAILRHVMKAAGGRRRLIVLAVEAYLGIAPTPKTSREALEGPQPPLTDEEMPPS